MEKIRDNYFVIKNYSGLFFLEFLVYFEQVYRQCHNILRFLYHREEYHTYFNIRGLFLHVVHFFPFYLCQLVDQYIPCGDEVFEALAFVACDPQFAIFQKLRNACGYSEKCTFCSGSRGLKLLSVCSSAGSQIRFTLCNISVAKSFP